mmetsp:Transcript_2866/g.8895  ORF Transcript_2866/g.8895 Transcript_2866/m.8895 type:complete len:217 (-) Transcript_2866:110-760(-)
MCSPIKWDEYNYPPFVRIMHFDLSELEGSSRKVVRWAHAGFFLLVAALMCNLLINFVLVCAGVPLKGLHIVYSLFNVIIFGGLGLYGEYASFKGVAASKPSLMRRYILLEGAIVVMSLLFSVMAVANWNGWMRLPQAAALEGPIAPFWFWATVVEAVCWTVNYIVGAVAVYHVVEFERNGPLAFSARATRGAKDAVKKAAGAASVKGAGGIRLARV